MEHIVIGRSSINLASTRANWFQQFKGHQCVLYDMAAFISNVPRPFTPIEMKWKAGPYCFNYQQIDIQHLLVLVLSPIAPFLPAPTLTSAALCLPLYYSNLRDYMNYKAYFVMNTHSLPNNGKG